MSPQTCSHHVLYRHGAANRPAVPLILLSYSLCATTWVALGICGPRLTGARSNVEQFACSGAVQQLCLSGKPSR
ncbi:hypothetical protein M405DRAFT_196971 [Rhizopogon salebrosus TDB-379]|nr:hypothetical protein M405DRAFT_196971 [Rhizopogon salebrosus TDB-379]